MNRFWRFIIRIISILFLFITWFRLRILKFTLILNFFKIFLLLSASSRDFRFHFCWIYNKFTIRCFISDSIFLFYCKNEFFAKFLIFLSGLCNSKTNFLPWKELNFETIEFLFWIELRNMFFASWNLTLLFIIYERFQSYVATKITWIVNIQVRI